MLKPIPIRQQIDRELDRLPSESLTQILAFARTLHPPQNKQQQYAKLWSDWFAEVDALVEKHHAQR